MGHDHDDAAAERGGIVPSDRGARAFIADPTAINVRRLFVGTTTLLHARTTLAVSRAGRRDGR